MSNFKRSFLVIIALIILMLAVPVQVHADPISALGLASAMDAYGMAYGIGSVYDVTSNAGISESFSGLWDDFATYQTNNNKPNPTVNGVRYGYDHYIEEWQRNNRAIKAQSYEHTTGKFACWSIDSETAEVFDTFWNWLLTGPAEMVRVDNQFVFNQEQVGDNAIPINVYHVGYLTYSVNYVPDPARDASTYNSSTILGVAAGRTYSQGVLLQADYNPTVYYFAYPGNSGYTICACSYTPNFKLKTITKYADGTYGMASGWISGSSNTSNFYYTDIADFDNFSCQLFSTRDAGLQAYINYIADPDSATQDVGIKSNTNTGAVTLPDITNPDYVPTAIEIATNVPWDDTYEDEDEVNGLPVPFPSSAVPNVIDDMGTKITAEDYALLDDPQPDPDPDPNGPAEVFLPFIPVNVPAFNFNLSGIWHYVREWVSSLGAWFSMVFTIWSILPYAIVVPVYATAVVVIVLGVYKRFFM